METTVIQPIQQAKSRNRGQIRAWVTPLTIVSFVLTAVTGLMLLFKMQLGLIKPVHEWLSVFFVISAILHVALNWRPMVCCFSQPRGRAILAIFVLLICATFLIPEQDGGTIPPQKTIDLLQRSSLAAVAQAANRTPVEAVQLLERQGIHAESTQSIGEIANAGGKKLGEVMSIVFQK